MHPGHPPSLENRPEELRGVQRSTKQWLQREEEVLQPADQMPRRIRLRVGIGYLADAWYQFGWTPHQLGS